MPEAPRLMTPKEYSALANTLVGRRYVLGQPSPYDKPNPEALDCSGLVIWLNLKSGAYKMGDDTAAGLYNRSKAVKGTPTVGDMVFLRNNPARSNGIGHMAVITAKLSNGDWRIVEARGRASGVVATTLSYWKTRKYYAGIRRLPGFKLSSGNPTPPDPSASKSFSFYVMTYNGQEPRFGGKNDDASVVNKAACSINLLTEFTEDMRNAARAARLGGKAAHLVWTRDDNKSQAIMFDKKKWGHTNRHPVTFGPTSYHGGVVAVLTRKANGRKVVFGVLHLPPGKVASQEDRFKYFRKFMAKVNQFSLPAVIGGDFNTEKAVDWLKAEGFQVSNVGPTTDSGSTLDFIAVRGGKLSREERIDPGTKSDHKVVKARVTIAGSDL